MENLAAPELPEPEQKACQDANCVAVTLQLNINIYTYKKVVFLMRVKIKRNRRMKKQKLMSTGGHLFQRFSICAYSCPICEAELFEHTIGSLSGSIQ